MILSISKDRSFLGFPLADRISNLQPPPANWTPAKIIRYRDESIEIQTQLQAASPFLALRLAEKIRNYPGCSIIDPQTP